MYYLEKYRKSDGQEINSYFTDPNDSDTDDDGFNDGEEVFWKTDPNSSERTPREAITFIIILIIALITLPISIFSSLQIINRSKEKIRKKQYLKMLKEKKGKEEFGRRMIETKERSDYANIPNLNDLIRNYVYNQLKAIQTCIN